MQLTTLYTFPLQPPLRRPLCSSLHQGPGGVFGFSIKALADSKSHGNISLFQIDVTTGATVHSSTSSLPSGHIDNLYLYYDYHQSTWIIGVESRDSLGVYEISSSAEVNHSWKKLRIIDSNETGLGQHVLVDLWEQGQHYPLVFYMTDIGEVSDSRLYWTEWRTYANSSQLSLSPIGYCDTVVPCLTEKGCLLFLCQRIFQQLPEEQDLRRGPGEWSISIAAYESNGSLIQQNLLSEIAFPIENLKLPGEDFFKQLQVDMSVTKGPLLESDGMRTYIAALVLRDIRKQPVDQTNKGGLYCVDAEAHIVNQERSLLGEQISLCVCGEVVIGTDVLEGDRRLWRWLPLEGTERQIQTKLSPQVRRATVVAAMENDEGGPTPFWCIEEYSEGVSVSLWTSEPVRKLEETWIEGITLLDELNAAYIRDQKPKGVLAYRDSLLLLGIDKESRLKLLRVQ